LDGQHSQQDFCVKRWAKFFGGMELEAKREQQRPKNRPNEVVHLPSLHRVVRAATLAGVP